MDTQATHLGSVSHTVRSLLNQEKTVYDERSLKNEGTNWVWPEVQKGLIPSLISDGFIANDRSIVLAMDKSGTMLMVKK